MNLVCIHGGLGNQMMQYTFMRALEKHIKEPVVLDDLDIENKAFPGHNGLELRRIFPHLKGKFVSDYLTKEQCEEVIEKSKKYHGTLSTAEILRDYGISLDTIRYQGERFHQYWMELRNKNPDFILDNTELQDVSQYTSDLKNTYFFGVWNSRDLFLQVREEILEELAFPPLPDEKNREFLRQIEESENAIGIHVRRGDFATVDLLLSVNLYADGLRRLREGVSNPTFFICSDDLTWCKENQKALGLEFDTVVYIEGNTKEHSYIDMQLLSHCDYLLGHAGSTFFICASRMNPNLKKTICVSPQ